MSEVLELKSEIQLLYKVKLLKHTQKIFTIHSEVFL